MFKETKLIQNQINTRSVEWNGLEIKKLYKDKLKERLEIVETINEVGKLRALGAVWFIKGQKKNDSQDNIYNQFTKVSLLLLPKAGFCKGFFDIKKMLPSNLLKSFIPQNLEASSGEEFCKMKGGIHYKFFVNSIGNDLFIEKEISNESNMSDAAKRWFQKNTEVIDLLKAKSDKLSISLRKTREEEARKRIINKGIIAVLLILIITVSYYLLSFAYRMIKRHGIRFRNAKIFQKYASQLLDTSERLIAERGLSKAIIESSSDTIVYEILIKELKQTQQHVDSRLAELESFIRNEFGSEYTEDLSSLSLEISTKRVGYFKKAKDLKGAYEGNKEAVEPKVQKSKIEESRERELEKEKLEKRKSYGEEIFEEYTKLYSTLESTFGKLASERAIAEAQTWQQANFSDWYAKDVSDITSLRWIISNLCQQIGKERALMTSQIAQGLEESTENSTKLENDRNSKLVNYRITESDTDTNSCEDSDLGKKTTYVESLILYNKLVIAVPNNKLVIAWLKKTDCLMFSEITYFKNNFWRYVKKDISNAFENSSKRGNSAMKCFKRYTYAIECIKKISEKLTNDKKNKIRIREFSYLIGWSFLFLVVLGGGVDLTSYHVANTDFSSALLASYLSEHFSSFNWINMR